MLQAGSSRAGGGGGGGGRRGGSVSVAGARCCGVDGWGVAMNCDAACVCNPAACRLGLHKPTCGIVFFACVCVTLRVCVFLFNFLCVCVFDMWATKWSFRVCVPV